MKRFLVLEDGSSFAGTGFGGSAIATGELAATTGNFGYQESLTDPANFGKILVFTSPLIGGTGISSMDYESISPCVRGVIANDVMSGEKGDSSRGLGSFLSSMGVPGIYGLDTRALIHHLKQKQQIKASIMDAADQHAFDQIKALVLPKDQSEQISTKNTYAAPNIGNSVAVLDLGLKHSVLRQLSLKKANITVVPARIDVSYLEDLRPQGLVISNGPGTVAENLQQVSSILNFCYGKIPVMAIGLGSLILAEYLGFDLVNLPLPFNGFNYPVIEKTSRKIWQTSMNVAQLIRPSSVKADLAEEFFDLHTGLVAGFVNQKDKAIASAFNPEGNPGGQDGAVLFDKFMHMMGD